jgi:TonB family protein
MTHLELTLLNYLLNALWQVPIIFLVAALAARLAKSAGPQTEHRIWVAALLLEATLPACAFAPALRGLFLSLLQRDSGRITTQTTILNATAVDSTSHLAATIASAVFIAYIATLLYLTARLLYRLHRTRTLCNAQPITLTGEALTVWQRCTRVFSVHDAHLATSAEIAGPSTIGIRRRIVLLPPTLLTNLSHEDLAAALAHEFAHMRRRDFAKNLLYQLIALPIAFHPLLWLTRLRIAESREMVCDELAARATQGTTRYAHSLLRLAATFSRPTPAATLHTIGILDANILERRVMTLNRKRPIAVTSRRIATAAVVLLGTATCATAMSLRLEIPGQAIIRTRTVLPAHAIIAPPIAPAAQQPNGPIRISGGVAAGQIISKVNPVYPPEAKEKGIQGTVVLHAIIGKDGTVQQLAVISGPPVLADSAIDAVKQWVYKPYLLNGDPTEVDTTITVNFSLENSAQPNSDATAQHPPSPPPPPADSYQVGGSDAGAYNVGGSVRPPVATYTAIPEFPEAARKAKLSGNVIVALVVDSNGQPQNVRVAQGLGNGLDEKAVEAVQQYRFKPATRDGEPVPVNLKVAVNFQIF